MACLYSYHRQVCRGSASADTNRGTVGCKKDIPGLVNIIGFYPLLRSGAAHHNIDDGRTLVSYSLFVGVGGGSGCERDLQLY